MSSPRVAVLFRTHFWDDFAFRAAVRLWNQCEGMDFFIEVNESESGPVDVSPFRKLAHTTESYERLGLPCIAPGTAPPLWWNADYGLYGALLGLPGYDYYFLIEYDVAVNLKLRPLVDQVIAAGLDCVTCFEGRPIGTGWAHGSSCADLPYAETAWVPLCIMLATSRTAHFLLSERRRLGQLHGEGRMSEWPISEGFFASALASGGFAAGSLQPFASLVNFGTETIYLEADPRTRVEGSFCHAVLDTDRFWRKFVDRSFRLLLAHGDYDGLRQIRDSLRGVGRTEHDGWRIASDTGNLALDRPARQSSCSAWSRQRASNRVDVFALDARGANCGVLTGRYCFHTDFEDAPWWAVELARPSLVDEVRIYNAEHRADRARRLLVQVSSDGVRWDEVYRKPDDRLFGGTADPLRCRLPRPAPARHVRVMLGEPGILHLDEVEVYGSALPE